MYIVIEKHGGWEYASVVTNEDGENKTFDTLEEAQVEADNCQDGMVVGDGMTELGEEGVDWNKSELIHKEVFQLPQDKGYKNFFTAIVDGQLYNSEENEQRAVLIELTLIQKWLRDKHGLHVVAFPMTKIEWGYSIDFQKALPESVGETYEGVDTLQIALQVNHESEIGYEPKSIEQLVEMKLSPEQALLEGIHEALKLI